MDTGNTLSFKGKPVIITNIENYFNYRKYLVPYTTVTGTSLLECIRVRKVEVINLGTFENIYLGFSKNINISGTDILLNGLMEG